MFASGFESEEDFFAMCHRCTCADKEPNILLQKYLIRGELNQDRIMFILYILKVVHLLVDLIIQMVTPLSLILAQDNIEIRQFKIREDGKSTDQMYATYDKIGDSLCTELFIQKH